MKTYNKLTIFISSITIFSIIFFTNIAASKDNLKPYLPNILWKIDHIKSSNNQLIRVITHDFELIESPEGRFNESIIILELYSTKKFKLQDQVTIPKIIKLPTEKIDLLEGTAYFIERIEYIPKTSKLEVDIDYLRRLPGEIKIQCAFLIEKNKINTLPCTEREAGFNQ